MAGSRNRLAARMLEGGRTGLPHRCAAAGVGDNRDLAVTARLLDLAALALRYKIFLDAVVQLQPVAEQPHIAAAVCSVEDAAADQHIRGGYRDRLRVH